VVSTNATQYISGPPTFDATTQTLDYKVAAPHYLPNGKDFEGSYNLEISNTLARCLYGFTDAPVSATISVIGVNGESKVSTTSMKLVGDFLRLSAEGFTFSSPTIRVKLSQPSATSTTTAATTTSKTEVAAAAPTKVTKKVITCVKGKSVKKVSGTKPKCPTGYAIKR
jgi:hypothetical protein